MNYPKFYIGPMSKNIVDAIIEFSNDNNLPIGLIPSRRQIDYSGGYVNNWKTNLFHNYVRSKSSGVIIERDHSGPGQGQNYDDGYESLRWDCNNFNLIHIDPWKEYPDYDSGLEETIRMIEYCHNINPNVEFEIGTEESIRPFYAMELENLLIDLEYELGKELFDKIKYVVIQCGTSLKGTNQTGTYDKHKLIEMINICKAYGKMSKEHNGDYQSIESINEKFSLGLDAINIAPEFGVIETQAYLDCINVINMVTGKSKFFDEFYKICLESKRWEKWVNPGFDPEQNKAELIKICGHYVLSYPDFITNIKNGLGYAIDDDVKNRVKNKLKELYGM